MAKTLSLFEHSTTDASGLAPAKRPERKPEPPAARLTDPESSHVAGKAVRKNGQAQSDRDLIYEELTRLDNQTAGEIAENLNQRFGGWNNVRVSRRTPELEAERKISRGPARICLVKQTLMVTWKITGGNQQS